MMPLSYVTSTSRPRWDGSRVLFDIMDGSEQVPCAISRTALEDIADKRCFKTADILASFAKVRGRIERLALEKLRARPAGISGRLSLWADDLDDPQPDSAVTATCREAASTAGA